ncbi:hypothetical protein O181_074506 [Austropuccinia psidii MF-1]|uniref:Peptidase A2 domain-containing protein n=1 Tax=Austropuccinia psidii MF-1 TaxID=1389203 RepID=A0A9Q3I9A2_9BASI|nr:hypothetical protein [Austropuccinia psidii MF-1]
MLETHAILRQTKKKLAKQESQNKEDSQSKKCILPGTYHEDDAEKEMKIIVPTKYKDKHTTRNETFEKTESKEKKCLGATENSIKKILEQEINLTLEKVLSVSPAFIHMLKGISLKEKEALKSVNTLEIEKDVISIKIEDFSKPRLHFACPLGFMQVFVGKEEYPVMALVDTGSELNIITEDAEIQASLPNRKLNINLRGIGGHKTSLIGLAEFTQVLLPSREQKQIYFFIAKGEVHTVLARPFLAENNIKFDFSQKQGEIFSYQEAYGRRLCMPICKPHMLEWQTGPPRGMELCSMGKIMYWFRKVKLKESEEKSKAQIKNASKKKKHSHAYENLLKAYNNHDSFKDIKPRLSSDSNPEANLIEVEVSPLKKDLMNTTLPYDSNPRGPWRIDKDKEMDLDKESFLKYYYQMSYWQLSTPEEEPDFIILP